MFASKQRSIGVKYYNDQGQTRGGKTYYYLIPKALEHYHLVVGGHVVVISAMTLKPEVCEIVDLSPSTTFGSKATKEIVGVADMTALAEAKAREARKEELLRALASREREIMADPMVRYARLASADALASQLYQELASL